MSRDVRRAGFGIVAMIAVLVGAGVLRQRSYQPPVAAGEAGV